MSNPEEEFNLLNQDSPSKSNFYNKVIPNLPHSLNDLLEKAKNVESKLDTNKNGANETGIENSELNKNTNLKEKQKRDTKFFEFDNFRRVNNYIPKIHINKHREGSDTPLPFYSEKDQNYKGIMSLFDEREFSPENNNLFYHQNNFRIPMKKNEENTLIRNDIDYDYSLPPNFYTNRYVEYIYEDRGDKLYDENNELKNLLGKNQNKDNKNNFINIHSPYLKAYNDLIEKEKEDVENENKEIYQNEMQRGQEFTLAKPEQEMISNFLNNNKELHKEKTALENYFEKNLVKIGQYKKREEERKSQQQNEEEKDKEKEKNKEKEKEKNDNKKYSPEDISFDIDILGEITKRIRGGTKKSHPRGIHLTGPIAKWYRQNEDNENLKLKGHFDIRKINFEETESQLAEKITVKSQNLDEDQEEYFTVRDVIEKGKVSKKDTVFSSKKIKEFGNKTFKYFFRQLKKYFTELLGNIRMASYNILKFLSDANITHLDLYNEHHKGLIDYILWHPKLKELSIPSSFLAKLKEVMNSEDWECTLTTLTIKKSISSDNNDDENLIKIFNLPSSLTIQNIHFIDMNYKPKFLEALFAHIDKFYSVNLDENEYKNSTITNNIFEELKLTKIPILNLSWKRTPNPNDTNKEGGGVSLKGIYYLLMYMLIKALSFNNGTVPEIFNKLDLSETSTIDESDYYLVKIITKFKIIKELDISNLRLKDQKILDLKNFFSQIKLTENYNATFDQKDYNETFLEDLREIIDDYRKINEKEKSEENYNRQNINSDDEDPSYDYSMGILPLLEKIYLYNTETKNNDSDEIYALFRRLKFFRGVYYTEPSLKSNQENNNSNFCDSLLEKINKDKKTFCENVFTISNDVKI